MPCFFIGTNGLFIGTNGQSFYKKPLGAITHMKNRGLYFEKMIEQANRYYEDENLAIVKKIPTPWKVKRGYDAKTKKSKIYSAFPAEKSTVDYIGISKGTMLCFEAKATENKTSFPLKNIAEHQYNFLEKMDWQGAMAFYLIHFEEHETTFILYHVQLKSFLEDHERKSIPYDWFLDNCHIVRATPDIHLNYLGGLF